MKTLDEVIKACEETVSDVDRGVDIDGCYLGATETRDALDYLKEYQQTIKWIEIQAEHMKQTKEFIEKAAANQPLTWQDLKQMEGKPVWVEGQTHKHWCIIKRVFYDDLLGKNFISLMFCNHKGRNDSYQRKESNLGKTWQAYRKERG